MDMVQIVIQAGSVGVALYAIYALSNIIGNYIDYNHYSTKVQRELAVAISELKEAIKNHFIK